MPDLREHHSHTCYSLLIICNLEHTVEEFDGTLALLAVLVCGRLRIDGDNSLLEIRALAYASAHALGVTGAVYGVNLQNLYLKQFFCCLCNFNLAPR